MCNEELLDRIANLELKLEEYYCANNDLQADYKRLEKEVQVWEGKCSKKEGERYRLEMQFNELEMQFNEYFDEVESVKGDIIDVHKDIIKILEDDKLSSEAKIDELSSYMQFNLPKSICEIIHPRK
jgi:predicted nuclease with TOPRIM domain